MKKSNLPEFLFAAVATALVVVNTSTAADYPTTVLGLNPAAYYRLNETASPVAPDLAVNGGSLGAAANAFYIGTPGVTYTHPINSGLIGNMDAAASFANGYVSASFTTNFNGRVFSAETWFYPNPGVSGCALSSVDFFSAGRTGFILYYGPVVAGLDWDLRMYTGVGTVTAALIQTNTGSAGGNWYHVVLASDGTNVNLYVNGASVGSRPLLASYLPASAANFTINGRSDGQFVLPGMAARVAYYPTALSAAKVLAHYQNGTGAGAPSTYTTMVLGDGATGYWPLNDAVYTVPDPNTYPVATNGGSLGPVADAAFYPGSTPSVPGVPFTGFGANNLAARLNGTVGDIQIPPQNLSTDTFSAVVWVKRDGFQHGYSSMLFQRGANMHTATGLDFGNANEVRTGWNDDENNSDYEFDYKLLIPDGIWSMVTAVWTPTNTIVYINGVASTNALSATQSHSLHDFSDLALHIGEDPLGGRVIRAAIDEVALFPRALSAAEVQSLLDAALVPPQITGLTQTPPGTLNEGQSATIAVSAFGHATLAYQWLKDGAPINGQTTTVLALNNVSTNSTGNYAVVITNAYGSATSSVLPLLVIGGPPFIVKQPVPESRYIGGSATFSVTVVGTQPISYQWIRDSAAIPGATSSSYTIYPVEADSTGNYSVALTNSHGASNSVAVALTPIPVTAPYAAAVIALKPDAYWRFNELSGATAFDYAGGNDGSLNGTVTNNAAGPQGPGFPGLEANNLAYDFASTNAYVESAPPNLYSNTFTAIALVNGAGVRQVVGADIVATRGGVADVFVLQYTVDGLTLSYDFDDDPASYGWLSGLSPTPGTWAFAAIAIGPTEATLYMDDSLGGGLQSAVNTLNAAGMAMETPFWIGADASTSFKNFRNFNGQIDEVAYFKRTLSPAEIQLIHDVLYLGPATLTISKDPSGVTLTWSRGTLQSAPTVSGPWADEGSASSPYQPGIGGTQKYFRLKL